MKIVFFSDAHGNQYTVRNLFQKLDKENADIVIYGGDIFGYYYGQKEILSLLKQSNCICLLGNHDQYCLDMLDGKVEVRDLVSRYGMTYYDALHTITAEDEQFIRALRSRYDVNIDGLRLSFVHGSIQDPLNGRVYPDTQIADVNLYNDIDYVFMGHTHHKLIRELSNGTILINPGSIGQQRDGKGCTYGVFDTIKQEWKIQEVQFEKSRLVLEVQEHNETEEMKNRLVEVIYRDKR